MKTAHLNDMVRGWFVGDFSPTVLTTKDFEVAVQHFKAGDKEASHIHRQATEITVLISGNAVMAGKRISDGDIVALDPGEASGFEALTNCITVVVKMPSVIGDKFFVDFDEATS